MSIREYKKPFISGIVFFLTITTLSVAYGALNYIVTINSASIGTPLSFVEWNKMISNFAALDTQLKTTNTTADNALSAANATQTALTTALPALVPTGAVIAFYGTLCPTGWAPADGATTVKKTDGSSSVLDLRGEFVRGLDTAGVGARDIDSGRTLGSWQKPSIVLHDWNNNNRVVWTVLNASANIESIGQENVAKNSYTSQPSDVSVSLIAATSTYIPSNPILAGNSHGWVVRPRNIALLYCVKN